VCVCACVRVCVCACMYVCRYVCIRTHSCTHLTLVLRCCARVRMHVHLRVFVFLSLSRSLSLPPSLPPSRARALSLVCVCALFLGAQMDRRRVYHVDGISFSKKTRRHYTREYVAGRENANDCGTGAKIESESECMAAARALGKLPYHEMGAWGNAPAGCLFDVRGSFYNTHAIGGCSGNCAALHMTPLCVQAAISSARDDDDNAAPPQAHRRSIELLSLNCQGCEYEVHGHSNNTNNHT